MVFPQQKMSLRKNPSICVVNNFSIYHTFGGGRPKPFLNDCFDPSRSIFSTKCIKEYPNFNGEQHCVSSFLYWCLHMEENTTLKR